LTNHKSFPIDALAVARAALREPNLPTAGHDQTSWEVKLLVDHGEHLVAERTRQINRLRWHLHQLDPDLEPATRRLPGPGLGRITAWLAQATPGVQVGICRNQVTAISSLTDQIGGLDRQLRQRVARLTPTLLDLPGCGPLTAAKLIARPPGCPVPLRGRLGHARRRGPDPGQLRPHRPPPAHVGNLGELIAAEVPGCMARPAGLGRRHKFGSEGPGAPGRLVRLIASLAPATAPD